MFHLDPQTPSKKRNISEWAEGELRGKTAKTWFSMVLGGGKVKLELTQLISEWAEGELREKKLRLWDQKNMQNLFLGQLGAQYKMWIHSSDTFKNHYQLKNRTVTKSNLLPVFTLKTRIRKWLLKVTWWLAKIVHTVQYCLEYNPPKLPEINSHTIQNVFYTLRIIVKQ